jgi:N-acyl-D-amino-acid deacylase
MRLRPARAAIEFVRRDGDRARAFAFWLREDDIATALSARFCTIGTAAPACSFHVQPFGLVHPRTFGTMPRVIGRFVRQRSALTFEEAVYRMTALPARTFGLDGHGVLSEGARADLLLVDEQGFVDTATYERPVSAPLGLKQLWVAGRRKGA